MDRAYPFFRYPFYKGSVSRRVEVTDSDANCRKEDRSHLRKQLICPEGLIIGLFLTVQEVTFCNLPLALIHDGKAAWAL